MQDIRNTAQGILSNPDTAQRLRLIYEALTLLNQNDQSFDAAIKSLQSSSSGGGSSTLGGVYRMNGVADGVNATFTATRTPLIIIVDGLVQTPGTNAVTGDYVQSGTSVVFNSRSIPREGASVLCM